MADVIVIAGTADARNIIGQLSELRISVLATVATKYGGELLGDIPDLKIYEGRLDSEGMKKLFKDAGSKCLIDASHPYACEVSINAISACKDIKVPYIRFERKETENTDCTIIRASSFEDAARKASAIDGNIFAATGSNSLTVLTANIPDYKNRLFVRVLPDSKVVAKCEEAGLSTGNIIAVKGPFTEAMNIEMLKHYRASVVITKDSGKEGGTDEKLRAAARLDIPVVMVERPEVDYEHKVDNIDEVILFVNRHI